MTNNPIFYVDTNIIRDVMRRRPTKSAYWLERIRENKWKCCTSIYGLMELLDVEQDHAFVQKRLAHNQDFDKIFREKYRRDLSPSDFQDVKQEIDSFLTEKRFIDFVTLSDDGWKLAMHIAANSNVFAPDAIHLASAWQNGVDILLTNDGHMVLEGNKILKMDKVEKDLKLCEVDKLSGLLQKMRVKVK